MAVSPRLLDRVSDDGPARRPGPRDRDPAQHRIRDGRPHRPRNDPIRRCRGRLRGALGADPRIGPADRRRPALRRRQPALPRRGPAELHDVPDVPLPGRPRRPAHLHRRTATRKRCRQSPDTEAPALVEIGLSEEAAAETHIGLGDTLEVSVDPGDPIMRNLFPRPTGLATATVVGLYTVPDPTDAYWFDDPAVLRAAVGGTVDNPIAFVSGVIAPEAYEDVFALDLPMAYRWRFTVDAAKTDAGQLEALVPDLRRLKTEFEAAGGVRDNIPNLRTGLGGGRRPLPERARDGGGGAGRRGARAAGGRCRRARPHRHPHRPPAARGDRPRPRAWRLGRPAPVGAAGRGAARDGPGRARRPVARDHASSRSGPTGCRRSARSSSRWPPRRSSS